jgi:hypothetical protein
VTIWKRKIYTCERDLVDFLLSDKAYSPVHEQLDSYCEVSITLISSASEQRIQKLALDIPLTVTSYLRIQSLLTLLTKNKQIDF